MSSFLLSLVSPVLRKIVCGNFMESVSKRINLDDVEVGRFLKLVRLACGEDGVTTGSIEELLDIGALAERLQMDAITEQAEDILLEHLKDSESTCVELFQASESNGLQRLRTGCYKMLRDRFQKVSHQAGFERLSEEMIESLLEEDELGAEGEEEIFEALVRWMKGSGERFPGESLLRKIRFGVINENYLANDMSSVLPGHEMLKELVEETLGKKRGREMEREWEGCQRLCGKWMVPRSVKDKDIGSGILKQPKYVAIDSQGHRLVSDSALHQVIVFNRDGSVVRRLGSQGYAPGEFYSPRGVAVDRRGRIVISDGANNRIQVLNADGSVVHCFGSRGTAVGMFNCPTGVAIDRNGHIVVADFGNHRIQVFDANGTIVRHFGCKGSAVGQFMCPRGVAVDRVGRIVVADCNNHRVQVFNGDGTVALCFGSEGDNRLGQLQSPHGVAVDRDGRFIVADTCNNRVQVFHSDGSVARIIDAAESIVGRLSYPCGVVACGTGRIVVVETGYTISPVRTL